MQNLFLSVIFASMIVFPFFIASLFRAQSPKRHQEALDKALSKGHVVTAVLKKRYGAVDDPYSRSRNGVVGLGIYEYAYKGKKYKYKLYDNELPSTVKLYFVKSPRKAVPEPALGTSDTCWPLIIALIACGIYLCFSWLSA